LAGMSQRIQEYRARAIECDRLARLAKDPGVGSAYRDMAIQWREMADQVEDLLVEKKPPHSN
jgi:hypothetical protein